MIGNREESKVSCSILFELQTFLLFFFFSHQVVALMELIIQQFFSTSCVPRMRCVVRETRPVFFAILFWAVGEVLAIIVTLSAFLVMSKWSAGKTWHFNLSSACVRRTWHTVGAMISLDLLMAIMSCTLGGYNGGRIHQYFVRKKYVV